MLTFYHICFILLCFYGSGAQYPLRVSCGNYGPFPLKTTYFLKPITLFEITGVRKLTLILYYLVCRSYWVLLVPAVSFVVKKKERKKRPASCASRSGLSPAFFNLKQLFSIFMLHNTDIFEEVQANSSVPYFRFDVLHATNSSTLVSLCLNCSLFLLGIDFFFYLRPIYF